MVIKNELEKAYPDLVSEYVLVPNPIRLEMAASSIYGTLPRRTKCHRRGNSDVGLPTKYSTYNGPTTKKSFFSGLANKFKSSVEGKPTNQTHRKLQHAASLDYVGSTGSISPSVERNLRERPQRLWARGLGSMYSSQRRFSSWKKSSFKKSSALPEVGSYSSGESSSVPSSPEFHRSFLPGNAKRARRSTRRSDDNGFIATGNRNSLTSQNSIDETKKSPGCKLLILGAEGVGKSALTVRFLTKRFIGEYAPEIESVYDQTMNLEGKDVNVQIWDSAIPQLYQNSNEDDIISDCSLTSSGELYLSNRLSNSSLEDDVTMNNNKPRGLDNGSTLSRKNKLRYSINKKIRKWRQSDESGSEEETTPSEAERRLNWADGIVVVYSICDKTSFEAARDVIHYIRKSEQADDDTPSTRIPILLVGNKLDLEHRRQVNKTEARKTASNYSCTSCELSVSDSSEQVSETIREHLISARKSSKARDALRSKSRRNK